MVLFDALSLPLVQRKTRQKTKYTTSKPVPDEGTAVTVKVAGEGEVHSFDGLITYTNALLPTAHNSLFAKLGTTVVLDLEDTSATMDAIVSRLRFRRDVTRPHLVEYSVTAEEVDNPT